MSKKRSAQSHDFTQVVREIPTLIVEEVRRNELSSHTREEKLNEKKTVVVTQKKDQHIYQSPRNSRRWMLIGVVLCAACIFGFWVLYISDLISKNKPTLNPVSSFTSEGDKDLSSLINTFSKMEGDLKKNLKSPAELKAMVASALLPLLTSSSTPTSTTKLTATSTTKE